MIIGYMRYIFRGVLALHVTFHSVLPIECFVAFRLTSCSHPVRAWFDTPSHVSTCNDRHGCYLFFYDFIQRYLTISHIHINSTSPAPSGNDASEHRFSAGQAVVAFHIRGVALSCSRVDSVRTGVRPVDALVCLSPTVSWSTYLSRSV